MGKMLPKFHKSKFSLQLAVEFYNIGNVDSPLYTSTKIVLVRQRFTES